MAQLVFTLIDWTCIDMRVAFAIAPSCVGILKVVTKDAIGGRYLVWVKNGEFRTISALP